MERHYTESNSSSFGFRNMEPRDRASREAVKDKTSLEKARVEQRRECFYRHSDSDGGNPILPSPGTTMYQGEGNRFDNDVIKDLSQKRLARIATKESQIEHRREVNFERAEAHWGEIEASHQHEQESLQRMKDRLAHPNGGPARNSNSVAYDPITLRYNDGNDGARLAAADEGIRRRAAIRAKNLYERGSGMGFNPINGEPTRRVHVPDASHP